MMFWFRYRVRGVAFRRGVDMDEVSSSWRLRRTSTSDAQREEIGGCSIPGASDELADLFVADVLVLVAASSAVACDVISSADGAVRGAWDDSVVIKDVFAVSVNVRDVWPPAT